MLNRLQDVFKYFQRHEVRYMVIGGVASVVHGVARFAQSPDMPREVVPPYLLLAFNIVKPTMFLPSLRIRMSSPISIVSVALWGLRKLI